MKGSLRVLLTILAITAMTAAVIQFMIVPLQRRVASGREAIKARRAQLAKLQRVASRINDLQQEVDRLEAALAFFEDRLPEEREIDVILREVWLIAEAKSLVARSVRTRKPTSTARYSTQPINVTLEGPFEGFYGFLLGLEQLPRITKVRQMQIQKSPTEEGAVQADLLVDIFFEK